MIIGITGNSGSGKTSISSALGTVPVRQNVAKGTDLNTYIIDADKVVKEMSMPGEVYFKEIVKEFGKDILLENGEIDKSKLASIIFEDEGKREILNSLTFKYVVEEISKRTSLNRNKTVIIDAPLLIESKLSEICDIVISVVADEEIKIKRICLRDNIDEDTAKKRINAQPKNDFYIKNSNLVILNNDEYSLEKIVEDIKEIVESKIINDEVVIIQDENSRILQFKRLLKYNDVLSHAFTLKPLDFGSNDTYKEGKENFDSNYKSVCELLKLDSKNIVRPYQTHTNNVKEVAEEIGVFPKKLENIDGLVTSQKNKILSLTFADCTPIYLFDKNKRIIGNIHSGWQGTVKRIAEKAIGFMKETYSCNPEDIICIIGPTIRECHFEVQKDVRDIFYNEFKSMDNIDEVIKYNKETNSYFINTVEINKNLLLQQGILEENIVDSRICSFCNSDIIHSYRKNGKEAGRNTALITLI